MNPSVLYEPEKFGLELLHELNHPRAGSYEYDKFVIWQDRGGRLLWAAEAGCSCPTPFEALGVDDLTEVIDAADFEAKLRDWAQIEGWESKPFDAVELAATIHDVKRRLAK